MDEFTWIDRLRPLTRGDPRALALRDDAAVLPGRPGYDLIISTDSMVEGVHWLAGEDPYVIARRLLRVSLSDLAAKAAEPFGYFLDAAWSDRFDTEALDRFIDGLREEGGRFDVSLLGGDTVTTIRSADLHRHRIGVGSSGESRTSFRREGGRRLRRSGHDR